MLSMRRTVLPALLAFVAALTLAVGVAPVRAWAEANTVYTATATPSYANPATGVIEDSGGAAQEALGQSMTESATYQYALVEYDANGTPYVTLRLQMMENISDVSIAADPSWSGSFYGLGYNTMQSNGSTADFQVQEDPSAIFRIQMYVDQMGRYVIFYITLSNLTEGNSDSFVQSVDTSAASADAGAAAAAPAAGAAAPAAASPAAPAAGAASTPAAKATTGAATTGAPVVSAATTGEAAQPSGNGIQEYDANGNPGDSSSDGTITLPVTGLVVGVVAGIVIGVVAIAIAVGVAVWLFTLHNRNAIERANAAAAAAANAQNAPVAHTVPAERAQQASTQNPSSAPDSADADALDETTVMPEPRPSNGSR